jgi:hypothetical protein
MGKPSLQALPAERWRLPAWLAAHWLAWSCRLGAGWASNYWLERRDYRWARVVWRRFRGFRKTFAGNAEFRLTRCLAITTKAGQESCSTMCASDVAGEKFCFNRGFRQAELLAKRLGVPHQGILC